MCGPGFYSMKISQDLREHDEERGMVRGWLSVGGVLAHRLDTPDELMHRADTDIYRAKAGSGVVPVVEREASPSP